MNDWLRLISLEAHETGADGLFNNDDEVVLQLNGEIIFEETMKTGDIVSFDNTFSAIPLSDVATITLYDQDSGIFGIEKLNGDDDFLGSHTITSTGNEPFIGAANFDQGGSHYTLLYEVTPGFAF